LLMFLISSGGNTLLKSFNKSTEAYASVGTITGTSSYTPKPFLFQRKNTLYIGVGSTIARYDASTDVFTASAITVPSNMTITSITNYGVYVAIGCAPKSLGENSKVYIWDGDASATDWTDMLDFGEGSLTILENLGGTLVGISGVVLGGLGSTYVKNAKLIIRTYNGGKVGIEKEMSSDTIGLSNFKARKDDKVYFPLRLKVQGNEVWQLWVFGMNDNEDWVLSPDRLLCGATAIEAVLGFNMIGDQIWTSVTSGLLRTTTTSYPTSTLDTLINPAMPIADKTKHKQLKAIAVKTLGAGGEITVSYKVDSGTWVEVYSGAVNAVSIKEATNESTGTPFLDGYEYQFRVATTDGVEIAEIKYKYDILPTLF